MVCLPCKGTSECGQKSQGLTLKVMILCFFSMLLITMSETDFLFSCQGEGLTQMKSVVMI